MLERISPLASRLVGPAGFAAETLRWLLGLFCALVGSLVLVAPHALEPPPYVALRPFAAEWGLLALAAGVALLAAAVLHPPRPIALLAHGLTGVTLLALAFSFALVGAWPGVIAFVVLSVGVAAAGFLQPVGRRDLFAFLMALIGTLAGFCFLALPALFASPFYRIPGLSLPLLGLGLFVTSPLLLTAQLRPPSSRVAWWAVHLAAGGAFVAVGLFMSLPQQAWTGVALYVGCGGALSVLPWLRRRIDAIDTRSLRTRLALLLATATSIALILAVAVVTAQEERLAAGQEQETHEVEALGIARNVEDFVQLNGARAETAAALAGRVPMEPELQGQVLDASLQVFPEATTLLVADPRGRLVAVRGPSLSLQSQELRGFAREADLTRGTRVTFQSPEPGDDSGLLVLSTPVLGERRVFTGVLVMAVDPDSLDRRLSRNGLDVTLADGTGRLIAERKAPPARPAGVLATRQSVTLPPLPPAWDRATRAGRFPYREDAISGFSLLSKPQIPWVVAVESPRAIALAGVRQGREAALGLLLILLPLAVVGGILGARRITGPLRTLAGAVDELTAGNPSAPLPASGIGEVSRLSTAFGQMRDRLEERTRESERLALELRSRAEALAESDRRKDEFLAMLAHELRNPLGAIANASYLLEQLGHPDPHAARGVAIIRRQVQHLVRLVDDLLDVSRITRGKVELRRERVDLAEVVTHAVEMARPLMEAKEHQLRVEVAPEPLPLDADPTRLEQVISNLLRNAAKYTDPGGQVRLAVEAEDGSAVVRVRDNGVGISPELLPRIFDLFIQGEQNLDRTGAGLGIGLTLVRSLVEMHGGRVEAHSNGYGKGAEFVVRLPLLGLHPTHQPQ